MKKEKTNPSQTVLTIVVGLIILHFMTGRCWILPVALAIGFAGIFSNYVSEKIDYLWMKLARLLGMIIPNILLALLFFFLLFPIAVLSRFFGQKDPLNLKNKSDSNFKDVNKEFDKISFKKIW